MLGALDANPLGADGFHNERQNAANDNAEENADPAFGEEVLDGLRAGREAGANVATEHDRSERDRRHVECAGLSCAFAVIHLFFLQFVFLLFSLFCEKLGSVENVVRKIPLKNLDNRVDDL